MKTWLVTYPTVGTVTVEVEAEDKEAAIEAGWDKTPDGEHQWETVEAIVKGNVFYGPSNGISVEEYD